MCNPLRDDGVSYGDYLEQLTYLIFLKMSDEYSTPPYRKDISSGRGENEIFHYHAGTAAVLEHITFIAPVGLSP